MRGGRRGVRAAPARAVRMCPRRAPGWRRVRATVAHPPSRRVRGGNPSHRRNGVSIRGAGFAPYIIIICHSPLSQSRLIRRTLRAVCCKQVVQSRDHFGAHARRALARERAFGGERARELGEIQLARRCRALLVRANVVAPVKILARRHQHHLTRAGRRGAGGAARDSVSARVAAEGGLRRQLAAALSHDAPRRAPRPARGRL